MTIIKEQEKAVESDTNLLILPKYVEVGGTNDDSTGGESDDTCRSQNDLSSSKRRPHSASSVDKDSTLPPPRKRTYVKRKEEKELLLKEMQQLKAQLTSIKRRARSSEANEEQEDNEELEEEEEEQEEKTLEQVQASNEQLWDAIQNQQLTLAAIQSSLHNAPLGRKNFMLSCPMDSPIHLTKDKEDRRKTLLALRPKKLRIAKEYLEERYRHVDCDKWYSVEEVLEKEDHISLHRTDLNRFEGYTVQEVYNALFYYFQNLEISVSEVLGDITVREDYDAVEHSVYHSRLVTAMEAPMMLNGVLQNNNGNNPALAAMAALAAQMPNVRIVQELNVVIFAEHNEEYALMNADFINQDDLYPYLPDERMRKDVTAGIMLIKYKDKRTGVEGVLMKRCAFLRVHLRSDIPQSITREVCKRMAQWGDIMIRNVNENLRINRMNTTNTPSNVL